MVIDFVYLKYSAIHPKKMNNRIESNRWLSKHIFANFQNEYALNKQVSGSEQETDDIPGEHLSLEYPQGDGYHHQPPVQKKGYHQIPGTAKKLFQGIPGAACVKQGR